MSIAERITSMGNNLSSAYGRIEYLGVDTSSIDKNLQNLSTVLDTVYNEYPKVSDEGISPSIDGSRVGRLNTTLKASDTTQFTTTGANKFSFNENERRVSSSATFKENQDNSLIFETTTGTWSNITYVFSNTSKNTDYYLKLIAKSSIIISSRVTVYGTNVLNYAAGDLTNIVAQDINLTANTEANASLTFNSGNYDYLVFRFWGNASGTTLSEKATMTFSNVMLSLTDTSYEPYTGGIPSPNPDYPQDIHVVKGNNSVTVCGKNLWGGFQSFTVRPVGGTFTTNTDGSITATASNLTSSIYSCTGQQVAAHNLYQELEAGTYTVSIQGTKPDYVEYQLYELPPNSTTLSLKGIFTSNNTKTFTLTEKAKMGVRVRVNVGAELNNYTFKIMIEKGSTATTYEPYNGTAYPINLGDIELCKIPTYQDKLFKAIVGDTVYDSLTSEQKEGLISGGWYKYGEAGNTLLNGSESYAFTNAQPTDTTLKSMTTKISDMLSGSGITLMPVLTSHFTYVGSHGIITNASTEECFRVPGTTEKRLGFITKQLTIEDFKTWLSTHNTTVYYVLATPTITQITDSTLVSQLEALYKAQSKNGQTNILQTNADVPFTIYASALKGG